MKSSDGTSIKKLEYSTWLGPFLAYSKLLEYKNLDRVLLENTRVAPEARRVLASAYFF